MKQSDLIITESGPFVQLDKNDYLPAGQRVPGIYLNSSRVRCVSPAKK